MVLNPGPSSAVALRVQTAATLQYETDGLHIDQSEAFLWCLKLATTYNENSLRFARSSGRKSVGCASLWPRLDIFALLSSRPLPLSSVALNRWKANFPLSCFQLT